MTALDILFQSKGIARWSNGPSAKLPTDRYGEVKQLSKRMVPLSIEIELSGLYARGIVSWGQNGLPPSATKLGMLNAEDRATQRVTIGGLLRWIKLFGYCVECSPP
jgi:hypothetical protein